MPKLYDNKYRFITDLGNGGFGKVFLAKEERSGNLVAIKQLKNEDKDDQDDIIHEMQMVSRFNYSRIITYKHHFIQDELLFIVMEYCPLGSLRDKIHQKKLTAANVWQWMSELTKTLQFVHEKGVIHHDIKPDNILLTEDGKIKITDFGLANKSGGTRAYLSPELLRWEQESEQDPRIDIYALGITLLELLCKRNPFFGKTVTEIIDMHERKDFGITDLPNWQQEIILKAIAKIPEQRFQSMQDFYEAIQARSIPIIFNKEVLQAGDLASKANEFIKRKKWQKAFGLLDYAENSLSPNVNVLLQKGKFHLLVQQIKLAKKYYEKALKLNPRLDVQKELGWINVELKNYPIAISLLSDHLHRSPSDYEAYNLLLQCYYETNRYEPAMDLAKMLLDLEPTHLCFANNYYICQAMHRLEDSSFTVTKLENHKVVNPFLVYNEGVLNETMLSHNYKKSPTLKSKLLFMDYRFNKFSAASLYCASSNISSFKDDKTEQAIIQFGREGYENNDVLVAGGTAISRRHGVIINCKDDVWLYDLDSTGISVNGVRVIGKVPLNGRNILKIGDTEFELTTNKSKLF